MSSLSEDELLDALNWSVESYNLAEFIDEFSLPQVVRVERGHDGGTDSSTLGYGEVLTLHAIRETRILAAEDKNGNAIAIGLNFPEEFQLLPQTKDCGLTTCGFTELPMLYQTVKYIEVIEAHYGTSNNVDTAEQGELFEILDISKPHKSEKTKVHVRNVVNDQKSTLTSTCTAQFRPLLDWKKYRARDLKTHQFGFPVRVRIFDAEDEIGEDKECQRLISKTPDFNVIDEKNDIVVITTTVGSFSDLKFCYEIPKDLEIRVAVAEGFSNGAKHYTDIVTSLNERFNITKFMDSHRPALIKRRDVIQQFDYEAIEKYITDKSTGSTLLVEVKQEEGAPALPPRPNNKAGEIYDSPSTTPPIKHKRVNKTKSFDVSSTTPPVVAQRMFKRKNSAPNIEDNVWKPKPLAPPRIRSSSSNCILDGPEFTPKVSNGTGDTPLATTGVPPTTMNKPNNPPQARDRVDTLPRVRSRKQPLPDPSNSFTYVPRLPPKSPATRPKKFPGNAWQVLPVSPNVSEYDQPIVPPLPTNVPANAKPGIIPRSSDVPEYEPPVVQPISQNLPPISSDDCQYQAPSNLFAPSFPPSVPQNPSIVRGLRRTSTPPSENEQDDEQIYDELVDVNPRVMPVAPIPKYINEENPYEISKIPLDLSGLSVMEVSDILRHFSMGMYAERFEEEMIDGDLLKELKEADLESFQMTSLHRTKLLKFIKGWRPRHSPKKHPL